MCFVRNYELAINLVEISGWVSQDVEWLSSKSLH